MCMYTKVYPSNPRSFLEEQSLEEQSPMYTEVDTEIGSVFKAISIPDKRFREMFKLSRTAQRFCNAVEQFQTFVQTAPNEFEALSKRQPISNRVHQVQCVFKAMSCCRTLFNTMFDALTLCLNGVDRFENLS